MPVTISADGPNSSDPQLVTSGTTITAIWRQSDGSDYRIQASSSTDRGMTWSTPVSLSGAGQSAFSPQLVTDGTTITAAWKRFDGSDHRIQVSSSADGGTTWSTPVTLSAAGQYADYPQLVTDGATITAAWNRWDGAVNRIQTSSSTDGGTTWGTPVTLSAAGQNAKYPQLVTDGTTITAAWTGDEPRKNTVMTSWSADGGTTWSAPVTLYDYGNDPQLVSDGATLTAVWRGHDGTYDRVEASQSTDGGATWSTPVRLSDAGQYGFNPHLVTDGTTITAVWEQSDGDVGPVRASSSTDGGITWSTPITLSDQGDNPQLVTDGTTITAAWSREDGPHSRVEASSSTDGGVTWSTPVTLSDPGSSAYAPRLVTDGTTVTVIWQRFDSTHVRIQVSSLSNAVVNPRQDPDPNTNAEPESATQEESTAVVPSGASASGMVALGIVVIGIVAIGAVVIARRRRGA